jgi:hypothetical protein
LRRTIIALGFSLIGCLAIATSSCGGSADRSITPPANPTPRPDPETFLKETTGTPNNAKASVPVKK